MPGNPAWGSREQPLEWYPAYLKMFNPSSSEIKLMALSDRMLFPALFNRGEKAAIPISFGTTATIPPPTPVLAGCLADFNAELEQFAVDVGCAPEGIVPGYPADQLASLNPKCKWGIGD